MSNILKVILKLCSTFPISNQHYNHVTINETMGHIHKKKVEYIASDFPSVKIHIRCEFCVAACPKPF